MSDLKRILDLIRADEKPQARRLLLELLKTDRRNEQAWLYLAACAANKREFEASIQQVLKLNPRNAAALKQAQKHGLPIPEAAKQAKKVGRQAARARSGGRRGLRLILLLLLIILGSVAAFALLNTPAEEDSQVETLATPEPTQEVTPDLTPEATLEATEEPTAEPTAAATEEIVLATVEATAEPTLEVAANPTLDLPISETVQSYVQGMSFATGDEESVTEVTSAPGDAPLLVVVRLADHGEDLAVNIVINARGGNQNLTFEAQAEAQTAHTVLFAVKGAEEVWTQGSWFAQLNLNNQPAFLAEIFILAPQTPATAEVETQETSPPTPVTTPTRSASPTPAISPTPTIDFPETEAILRMVYTPESAYLLNIGTQNVDISGLRFVQNLGNGDQIAFNATEWELTPGAQGAGTIYQLQPNRCFQVGTSNSSAQRQAPECDVLNAWQTRDLDGQFWLINNGNLRTFLVLQNGIPLVECSIDAGSCEFGLLPQ
jgi:hypothetical protein